MTSEPQEYRGNFWEIPRPLFTSGVEPPSELGLESLNPNTVYFPAALRRTGSGDGWSFYSETGSDAFGAGQTESHFSGGNAVV